MSDFYQDYPKDTVILKQEDTDQSLMRIEEGKVMICSISGTQVTPLAHLGAGEFIGEFSFFDGDARSANIIAIENTKILKIPSSQLKEGFPNWLLHLCKQMTKKLRLYNQVVSDKGIKRKNVESMKPLSIDDQRHYFQLIENS
jgi:CRP/FNR family cyclic AMP-dependent transcriptional regulator